MVFIIGIALAVIGILVPYLMPSSVQCSASDIGLECSNLQTVIYVSAFIVFVISGIILALGATWNFLKLRKLIGYGKKTN